jgi:hypothetical protein
MEYKKISSDTVEITEVKKTTVDVAQIISSRDSLIAEKDSVIADYDGRIAELNDKIKEFKKVGIDTVAILMDKTIDELVGE